MSFHGFLTLKMLSWRAPSRHWRRADNFFLPSCLCPITWSLLLYGVRNVKGPGKNQVRRLQESKGSLSRISFPLLFLSRHVRQTNTQLRKLTFNIKSFRRPLSPRHSLFQIFNGTSFEVKKVQPQIFGEKLGQRKVWKKGKEVRLRRKWESKSLDVPGWLGLPLSSALFRYESSFELGCKVVLCLKTLSSSKSKEKKYDPVI